MEIKLKIIQVLPEQEGIDKNGNPWKVASFVGETFDTYPRKVSFEIFGEDRISKNPCALDDVVNVSFDIESREYNGRWYTSIRAWKVEPSTPAAQPVELKKEPTPAAAPKVEGAENASTELSF